MLTRPKRPWRGQERRCKGFRIPPSPLYCCFLRALDNPSTERDLAARRKLTCPSNQHLPPPSARSAPAAPAKASIQTRPIRARSAREGTRSVVGVRPECSGASGQTPARHEPALLLTAHASRLCYSLRTRAGSGLTAHTRSTHPRWHLSALRASLANRCQPSPLRLFPPT